MKAVDNALAIAEKLTTPEGNAVQDVVSLLRAAKTKSDRAEKALDAALELLGKVRYCHWPTIGLGIGLSPEELDEVLYEGEAALRACRRKSPRRH